MSKIFADSEDVPFVWEATDNKVFRMEGDNLIPVFSKGFAFDIRMRAMPISEERALKLAGSVIFTGVTSRCSSSRLE